MRLSALLDADIRQFTNQWKPVQSYDAIYFHLVTLHFVVNGKVLKRNEPTLRWATQTILGWFPLPLALRLDYTNGTLHNFPAGEPPQQRAVLPRGECLPRSAQRNQRKDCREHYRRNKKRQLTAGPRRVGCTVVADVPGDPVPIFDVLWHFRRWANYLEADTIIEGGEAQPDAIEFDECFNDIMKTTATTLESILCRYLGRGALHALYQEFIALAHGRLDTAAVERRRDVSCGVVP
jgi:hypothetical protein